MCIKLRVDLTRLRAVPLKTSHCSLVYGATTRPTYFGEALWRNANLSLGRLIFVRRRLRWWIGSCFCLLFYYIYSGIIWYRISLAGPGPPGPCNAIICDSFPCLVFEDNFDNLDLDTWEHEITAGGGGVKCRILLKWNCFYRWQNVCVRLN